MGRTGRRLLRQRVPQPAPGDADLGRSRGLRLEGHGAAQRRWPAGPDVPRGRPAIFRL